jgi:hypothetical protein
MKALKLYLWRLWNSFYRLGLDTLLFWNVKFLCVWVVLLMFLKLKEFGGILFQPEESVSVSLLIVCVGPYVVVLVCIPSFIDDLFRVYLIFWFLNLICFGSRCTLFLSGMMDYIVICLFGLLILILAWNWI